MQTDTRRRLEDLARALRAYADTGGNGEHRPKPVSAYRLREAVDAALAVEEPGPELLRPVVHHAADLLALHAVELAGEVHVMLPGFLAWAMGSAVSLVWREGLDDAAAEADAAIEAWEAAHS